MRSNFRIRSLLVPSLVLAFAFSVLTSIVVASYLEQQQHPAGTETTWSYDPDGSLVQVDTTYDEKGRVTEKKEYDKNKKLRKRTSYKYLNGFKEPDTSTTTYQPDGQTARTTTNADHDKDGNPTVTVTTNYDEKGTETGGTKRERDPKTGKEHCYKWDPKKQQYDEVPCPLETAQPSSQPPAKPSPGVRVNITDRDTRNNTCTCGESKTPCPCPSPSPTPTSANSQNARVETGPGLRTVIFDTPPGLIRVNLPDDMRAGDTISGTVIQEPKGQTKEERAKNQTELNGLVVQIDGKPLEYFPVIAKEREGTIQSIFYIYRPADPKPATQPKTATPTRVSVANAGGSDVAQAIIPVWSFFPDGVTPSGAVITPDPKTTVPTTSSGAVITPDQKITPTFIIPPLGQTGRAIVITGPFDGNSSNTSLNWTAIRSTVQDFEKNTENVSGGFGLLAESPRKAVFEAPSNVTGPIELHLTEGKTQTTGNYRNVGVNLSAPKTSLLKGERTTLTVQVTGLQGLTQPVPLTLESHGVIAMEGGIYQPLVIQPSQVGPDGRYTTTRGITGVQAGGWTAAGTVVTHRFDFCLQDDSSPQTVILINTFTGDYIFPQPSGANLEGSGTVTRKDCIFTLTDNRPDRRVQSKIDPCAQTGSASVQTSPPNSPKVKFTITDRNTKDNTCACGPGCK